MTIQFVNPAADCLVAPKPYTLWADLRQPTTLGLLINDIVDCDLFMDRVGERLAGTRPRLTLKRYRTRTLSYASPILIEQVARECDVALCAIGHCGSCTGGSVKDGIALIEAGCPAVSLITEHYWEQAETLARSLGWSAAPRVRVPYLIWGTSEDFMRAVAGEIAPAILAALETANEHAA